MQCVLEREYLIQGSLKGKTYPVEIQTRTGQQRVANAHGCQLHRGGVHSMRTTSGLLPQTDLE